jgi:hypothetical protein
MCECSATHSESKPRSSSAIPSSAGEIEYSVKKIEAPISIIILPLEALLKHELAQPAQPQLKIEHSIALRCTCSKSAARLLAEVV